MDTDYGIIIGLITVLGAAGILCLSYVGAFMVGQQRGRRDAERELRADTRDEARIGNADRLLIVESAVDSVARAMERLSEAQRIVLLEQARSSSAAEPRNRNALGQQRNTPS